MDAYGSAASGREVGRSVAGSAPRLGVLLMVLLSSCSSLNSSLVAPPRLAGSIGAGVISRSVPDSESELIVQSLADINADSYIWQPWFAPLRARGGIAYERRSGRTGSEGDAIRFNGDASLSILPQSRFPAHLSYSRLDSRVNGEFIGSDFVQNRLAFSTTSIITSKFRANLGASADWSEQAKTGDRQSRRFYGGATKTFGRNFAGLTSVSASVDYTDSDFDSRTEGLFGEDIVTATFSAQAAPAPNMLNNLIVTYIFDDEVSRTTNSERRSLQAVNTFNWNPEDKIYDIDGFIRARMEDIDFGDSRNISKRRNDQLLGVANVQIPLSERLHLRVGVRAGTENQSGSAVVAGGRSGERSFAAANASVNYYSRTREFGAYEWRWGARAAGEAGWASEDDVLRDPSAAVDQTLERDIPFFGETPARLSFTQEVGVDAGAVDRDTNDNPLFTPIVSHGLTLSHNAGGLTSATSLIASLRDVREFSGERNSLQTAQIQFSRREAIDARRSFTGVLTGNAIRRNLNDDPETIISASGRLVYNERSLFNALNLDFRSELAVNIFELDELFSDDSSPTIAEDNQHHEWRNILTYRIGQIAIVGEVSAFYEDEGFGRLLMFRIRRDFGGN